MSSQVLVNESHVARAVSPERGMMFALGITVAFLTLADGWNLQLSLGPGLSAKNAILYVLAMALATKIVMQGRFEFELRGLHACFAALILYAILSILVLAFIVSYPRYGVFKAIIDLKVKIVDHAMFFLVFFYGLRESRNARYLLGLLLFGAVFANALAVFDALGLIRLSELEIREDGRVGGVFGESNQYGAYVALFVPALLAGALASRGMLRLWWTIGAMISIIALMMTVSRGAYVACIIAVIWAAALLPRHIPIGKIVSIGGLFMGVLAVVLLALSASYGDLIADRLLKDSTSGDMVSISSGRTEIWTTALLRMAETPISFITGFGLGVYDLMPFKYASHNHYLWLWFDLGLVGLVCGVLLFALVISKARAAIDNAPLRERYLLIAFIVGTLAYAVATFFVNLFSPWTWFWAYAGLMMRIAVNACRSQMIASQETTPEPRKTAADLYGWVAPARHAR